MRLSAFCGKAMRHTQTEAKVVLDISRRENKLKMFDIACGLFVGMIVVGTLFIMAKIMDFIVEIPRQLKRIADELERRNDG